MLLCFPRGIAAAAAVAVLKHVLFDLPASDPRQRPDEHQSTSRNSQIASLHEVRRL